MLGLLRTTTVVLAVFANLSTSSKCVPKKEKSVENTNPAPLEPMPDCEECKAPTCNLSQYTYKSKVGNLLYPAQDKKYYKERYAPAGFRDTIHGGGVKQLAKGDIKLIFEQDISRLGVSGRIDSSYDSTAIIAFDVMDAKVEVSQTPQKRNGGFEKVTLPKGKDLPPIYLISQPGKKCKFNIFPSGFDQNNGKMEVYSKVDDLS